LAFEEVGVLKLALQIHGHGALHVVEEHLQALEVGSDHRLGREKVFVYNFAFFFFFFLLLFRLHFFQLEKGSGENLDGFYFSEFLLFFILCV